MDVLVDVCIFGYLSPVKSSKMFVGECSHHMSKVGVNNPYIDTLEVGCNHQTRNHCMGLFALSFTKGEGKVGDGRVKTLITIADLGQLGN